ncbi:hypothetical protein JCM1840_002985, partial [Sporobolomyces johnsonii]
MRLWAALSAKMSCLSLDANPAPVVNGASETDPALDEEVQQHNGLTKAQAQHQPQMPQESHGLAPRDLDASVITTSQGIHASDVLVQHQSTTQVTTTYTVPFAYVPRPPKSYARRPQILAVSSPSPFSFAPTGITQSNFGTTYRDSYPSNNTPHAPT